MIRRDEWFHYPASQQMEQLQIHCELLQAESNTICQKRNQSNWTGIGVLGMSVNKACSSD